MTTYLLIGHISADLTEQGRQLGGTVAYAARAVQAIGLPVNLLTSAAPDEPLLDELRGATGELVSVPAGQTTSFENIYTPAGRIQYVRGVAENLRIQHVPDAWRSSSLVHLAPLADEVDPAMARFFDGATVMLTLQGWLRQWGEDGLVRFKPWFDPDVLRHINIVVFSEEDIAAAPELEAQFAGVVEHLFVTRAARGGTYYHRGQPIPYETPQVQEVHPTGAGDIFAASVLAFANHFRSRSDGNLLQAARAAAVLAALSTTRVGLDGAPTPAEVQYALNEVEKTDV